MAVTNLGDDAPYMGFVTQGLCVECKRETFAQDGICYLCKVEESEAERLFDNHSLGLDCE